MQDTPKKRSGLHFVVGLCAVGIAAGLGAPAASAQDFPANASPVSPPSAPGVKPQSARPQSAKPAGVAVAAHVTPATQPTPATASASATPLATDSKPVQKVGDRYYVDFRSRTAASYGHAFVWYGRTDERKVEVAGLHPATDSVIPYILGHVLLVPSETGASYGDLDEQYLTAHYRVLLNEADAKRVIAYIKHLQATSPVWNAATYNCVAFISDIAQFMGLKVPSSNLLYPEDWVNSLRELNGGRKTVRLTTARSDGTRPVD